MDVPIAIRRKSARMSGFIAFLLSGFIRRGDAYGCMPYGGKESLMALHGYAQHILCLVSLVFLIRLRLGIEGWIQMMHCGMVWSPSSCWCERY